MWNRNTTTGTAIVYKNSNKENIVLDYKLDGAVDESYLFKVNKMDSSFLQHLQVLVPRYKDLSDHKVCYFNYNKLKDNTMYMIKFYVVYDWEVYEEYDGRIKILNDGKTITACSEGFYVISCEETISNKIDLNEPKFGDFVTVYNYRTDEFLRAVVIKRISPIGNYLIITEETKDGEYLELKKIIKTEKPKKDSFAYMYC